MRLTSLELGVCLFGLVGTLLFAGVFGDVSGLIKLIWGLGSVAICLFAGLRLLANLYIPDRKGVCLPLLSLCFNVVPSILFVIWYTGKTQVPTPPGCC